MWCVKDISEMSAENRPPSPLRREDKGILEEKPPDGRVGAEEEEEEDEEEEEEEEGEEEYF